MESECHEILPPILPAVGVIPHLAKDYACGKKTRVLQTSQTPQRPVGGACIQAASAYAVATPKSLGKRRHPAEPQVGTPKKHQSAASERPLVAAGGRVALLLSHPAGLLMRKTLSEAIGTNCNRENPIVQSFADKTTNFSEIPFQVAPRPPQAWKPGHGGQTISPPETYQARSARPDCP